MKKNSPYFERKADKHAAVQNLRRNFREYLNSGGSRLEFARSMGMSLSHLNQYLTGIYSPTSHTVIRWAELLSVSFEEMMSADFEYIPYPFEEMYKPKKPSRHITKGYLNQLYESTVDDYHAMVSEGVVSYDPKIEELFDRFRI